METIWSSLLLGSGLISNWIMSPRDLSNQVLKNLQGQFPTVLEQPVPGLFSSLCALFFLLNSYCNFLSVDCDCNFFPFTVHPCEASVCICCNSPGGKQIPSQPSDPISSAFTCRSSTPASYKSWFPSSELCSS